MADGILAAVNENGNIDRFIDTKGGVHYIEPKRYEESVAKIDAAATKAKETVNSATEAVSECKAQTGACTQETARAKEIADTVESRITGIEGDVAALRDSVSRRGKLTATIATSHIDKEVTFDKPLTGDYAVVLSIIGIPMYWTRISLSSYSLTPTGFKIQIFNDTEPTKSITTDIAWFAFQL